MPNQGYICENTIGRIVYEESGRAERCSQGRRAWGVTETSDSQTEFSRSQLHSAKLLLTTRAAK